MERSSGVHGGGRGVGIDFFSEPYLRLETSCKDDCGVDKHKISSVITNGIFTRELKVPD